jgi:hypothetical protein
MSLASADDWPNALDLFQVAYEQRTEAAPRSRFNDSAHLLAAQVSVRTWHDAEASLNDFATDLASVRSGRTTALLRRILREINADQTAAPPRILDSAERLAALVDGAG